MRSWPRAVSTAALAAVIATALVMATPSLGERTRRTGADAVSPAAAALPWIKSGWKNGPVHLGTIQVTIASLALPAGKYAVSAKLWARSGSQTGIYCVLKVAGDYDQTVVDVGGAHGDAALPLQVVGNLTGAGAARLQCWAAAASGDPVANFIKITAIKAGTLRNVTLP